MKEYPSIEKRIRIGEKVYAFDKGITNIFTELLVDATNGRYE